MRKKFDIKYRPLIESGEYKVVTDWGESVEIVKWNCKGKCPILAVIDDGDTSDSCFFTEDGSSLNEKDRLYIETPELELTEFERVLTEILIEREYKDKLETEGDVDKAYEVFGKVARELAPRLLFAAEHDEVQYQRGYAAGKADVLKDIPQWHRIKNFLDNKGDFYVGIEKHNFKTDGGTSVSMDVLRVGNRYLVISELKHKLLEKL